jgi:hypothetical protein
MSGHGADARGLGILLMLIAALAAPGLALACSCMWGGPLTKVALRTDLIVLAEVRSYHRHSMDVAVIEVLKGADERAAIRIWGDTGALCRPYVTGFPRGTRWIFALQRLREPGARDYVISNWFFWPTCGPGSAPAALRPSFRGRFAETWPGSIESSFFQAHLAQEQTGDVLDHVRPGQLISVHHSDLHRRGYLEAPA